MIILDRCIIVMEDATQYQIEELRRKLMDDKVHTVVTNKKCKIYEIKDDKVFEVVQTLKEVKQNGIN